MAHRQTERETNCIVNYMYVTCDDSSMLTLTALVTMVQMKSMKLRSL